MRSGIGHELVPSVTAGVDDILEGVEHPMLRWFCFRYCQKFSTGFSSGKYGGKASRLMLSGVCGRPRS